MKRKRCQRLLSAGLPQRFDVVRISDYACGIANNTSYFAQNELFSIAREAHDKHNCEFV